MARLGFIHDKLDIKFLILYLMARVAAPVDFTTLAELSFCDEGVSYFEFAESLAELVKTEHLCLEEERYSITEKGRRNGSVCESNLAYSVRRKCEANLARVNTVLRRDAQVRTESEEGEDGSVKLLPVAPPPATTVDRVIETVPEVVDKVTGFIEKQQEKKAQKAAEGDFAE